MKSKQQTPLGYLMGLLDVSLADLSDYLFVAQTSISKWKTGARILKPSSQHFAGIVEYFAMLSRDADRREKMVQLFGRLYPEQTLESPQDIAQCVRAFLGGKLLPSVSVQQALGEEGRLYTAQVGVYHGEAGTTAAFSQFCGYLMEQGQLVLSIICRRDPAFLGQIQQTLQKGHRMRLLVDTLYPRHLFSQLAALLTHPNVEARLLDGGPPFPEGAACCMAGKELMLMTNTALGHAPYAAMYTDALTIEQHQKGFDNLWHRAERAFTVIPGERLGPDTYREAAETSLDNHMDWLTPSLPYLTMSDELLMEVLKANGVSGRVWTHVLSGRDVLADMPLRLFIPASALHTPQTALPALSMLCGMEVRMTEAQARRQMFDTAALLRAEKRLSIVPLQSAGEVPISAFVWRNAFAGYLACDIGTVRLAQNPTLVEAFMAATDDLAAHATREARSASYVAGILERAALDTE